MWCVSFTHSQQEQKAKKNLSLLLLTFFASLHRWGTLIWAPAVTKRYERRNRCNKTQHSSLVLHGQIYTITLVSCYIFFGFNALMLLSLSRPDSFPSPLLYGPHPSRLRALTGLPKDITRASLETCRHPPPLFAAKINCSPSRCFVSSSVSLAGNLTASLTLSSSPAL